MSKKHKWLRLFYLIPFSILALPAWFYREQWNQSLDCAPWALFANSATILALSLALFAVVWKLPKKYLVPQLKACFYNPDDFACDIPQANNQSIPISEKSCYLSIGFKNSMWFGAIKPKVCIEVPKHLWHMQYLTDVEMDRYTTKEGFRFRPSKIVPGCCAIMGKGGHELSRWCKGTGPDGHIWVKLTDNKKCVRRTCRSYVSEEDRNYYRVVEKCTRMLIFADINFVPNKDHRKFWVRVRIPDCGDCTKDNTVKLHLSFPFFQSDSSFTYKYTVCPHPHFNENYCRDQDI